MKIPKKNEIRKPTKTLSGVTPVAVMCKPKKCNHGTCLYCPSLDVPQSYTPKSPPVLRAEALKYDSFKQVQSRLKAFDVMNHPTNKIELIVMGGNFLEYPEKYKYHFIKNCYDALNNKKSKTLEQAKKLNEKAKHRCTALCIESRPDTITPQTIKQLFDFGCTRVELGVQALDDNIYKKVNRNHRLKEVIEATQLLKEKGFKIGYHMMLALPGSNQRKDLAMFKKLFKDEKYKPDQLKIYPCQVLKGAKLVGLFKKGKYKPYTKEQTQNTIIKILKIIPNYCRVMRIMREIPPEFLVAGTTRIDLRKDITDELKKEKAKINEIRFREIGFAIRDKKLKEKISQTLKLKTTKYKASGADEYFLEFINKDNILFGLLRLRIQNKGKMKPSSSTKGKKESITSEAGSKETVGVLRTAIVRELHVYGKTLNIGQKPDKEDIASQHKGLGKALMKQAEAITKQNKIKELAVISGIGVREYYKKLGYKLKDNYMVKKI